MITSVSQLNPPLAPPRQMPETQATEKKEKEKVEALMYKCNTF